jgi:acetyl esterase
VAVEGFFHGLSMVARLHPRARPHRHGVVVKRNIAYRRGSAERPLLAEHRLDVYRPRDLVGPLPTVLYIHGGGFRILSKDTHWVMGLAFARAGMLVFNISYRLAPRHPFPAAVEDCADALDWVIAHADSYGADLDRLVIAGESAGANLSTTLALLTCYERDEPLARQVHRHGVVPRVLLPYCGMLQVSDVARFKRRKPKLSSFVNDRLVEVSHAYIGPEPQRHGAMLDLADPLSWLERAEQPSRPLPPCLATVGTADPLLDDTRRLQRAYQALGGDCRAIYYPRQPHAFHAAVWRKAAKRCWRDSFRFLGEHIDGIRRPPPGA